MVCVFFVVYRAGRSSQPSPRTAAHGGAIFTLTKWYLDAVDGAGRVMIAYWARLAMGELSLTWHAQTEFDRDSAGRGAWSIAAASAPRRHLGKVEWNSDALGLSVTMEPHDTAHELTLLDTPSGAAHWRGETMAAHAKVERDGKPWLDGVGYAECLTLTLAPWRLPIDSLEWGHWIADDCTHASTWFRWRGAHPLSRVVEDGRDADEALVDGTSVATATSTLVIAPERLLERRRLGEILSPIPLLSRAVPDSLMALEEEKWLGRGTRRDRDGTAREGWAVYEAVRFLPSDA